MYKSNW